MITIYPLTSSLHDEDAVRAVTEEFLGNLGIEYRLESDWTAFGCDGLPLIYVRTGGTEGLFREILPSLPAGRPVYLLASGKSNSLAASMEILSYLNGRGLTGEILHGSAEYIASRIRELERVDAALRRLRGLRLGVIGKPSDWLIASDAPADALRRGLGIERVDIPMETLLGRIASLPEGDVESAGRLDPRLPDGAKASQIRASLPGAERIYEALKALVEEYGLGALTIRCFDLLDTVKNTGCLALVRLNAEGITAGCEGDVPALLSMCICRALTGVSGFQANPSRIDPVRGEVVFAHCTVPLDMVEAYSFDTHYESGIGVGIRGRFPSGPVTVFKVSGDLKRCFAAEGLIERNLSEQDLCRTQVVLHLEDVSRFLTRPIGNHHIIVPGHCASELIALCRAGGMPEGGEK